MRVRQALPAALLSLAPLARASAQQGARPTVVSAAALVRAARPAIDSANAAWLPAMRRRDAAGRWRITRNLSLPD